MASESLSMAEAAASSQSTASAAATADESSRIFVKNLPPNITEDQLRSHFSGSGRQMTDMKLIARRRIAFIGYRSPQEAKDAVRYFNRSFIRMSKLSVELAKPISDPSLPTARKMKRLHEMHAPTLSETSAQAPTAADDEPTAKRRKQDDLDVASNPKLREFLGVMQTQSSKGLSSTADVLMSEQVGEAGAAQAEASAFVDAGDESENEEEYQSISTRKAKTANDAPAADAETNAAPTRPTRVTAVTATSMEEEVEDAQPIVMAPPPPLQQPKVDASATDDDWLRARTNRLLDLLDPSELPTPVQAVSAARPEPTAAAPMATSDGNHVCVPDNGLENVNDSQTAIGVDVVSAAESTVEPVPNTPLSAEEQIRKTSRLFVRNLPYGATEKDIRKYFAAFGAVVEVQLPVTDAGANKGFAMVLFSDSEAALAAFHNADGKTFQGRILHVLPSKAKRTAENAGKLDEFALSKLPLKKQRLLRLKAEAAERSFSWNSLFMSQDAVNAAMAERLGVTKSELLDPTSSDEAVRQAMRQTSIIEETKDYFEANGVDLESFKSNAKRGDRCILVKNFAHGTSSQELRKMFEEYGSVVRVLMPPSGTLAIVQFAQAAHGRLAYSNLTYRRMNDTVLMLEKCPEGILGKGGLETLSDAKAKAKLSGSDLLLEGGAGDGAEEEKEDAAGKTTSSLFVRNLNFTTTTAQLAEAFSPLAGFVAARVKTKADPKKPGQVLSMGYGFVEFRTKAEAAGACQVMDGHILQGHTLTVKASHRGAQDAAEQQREADRAKKEAANKGSKLIIKNIPFEASRKDLRTLLGTYGQLRAVRMPKKFGNNTRGYAFAEFVTAREAAAAMSALRNTHLLGRRLVIEFAEAEAVDAEEEIAKMQKKVGAQMDSVAMQQLATSRSHRSKVHIGEEEET